MQVSKSIFYPLLGKVEQNHYIFIRKVQLSKSKKNHYKFVATTNKLIKFHLLKGGAKYIQILQILQI